MEVGERQVIRSLEAVAMEALQEVEEAMAPQVEEDMELLQVDFQVVEEDMELLQVDFQVEEEDMEVPQVDTEVAMEGQQVDFQAEDMEELPVPVLVEDLVVKCRCSNAALCRSKSVRMSLDNNARQ